MLRKLLIRLVAFSWILAGVYASASETGAKPNRLSGEKSRYLRQHALNPVDWFPWGPEAFEKARQENKPIFLSIGYSTCHWCHVMEQESFSDAEIAAYLNANFVCIKVDREERPDIDRIYMTFVQASTGSGGWPLSVWLTPERKPFFGGTYFAPESRRGQPGFKTILTRIADRWKTHHDEVVQRSDEMLTALAADTQTKLGLDKRPTAVLRNGAFKRAIETFDEKHGGFESPPKFPQPALLEFLLDVNATSNDAAQREKALRMVLKTLRAMDAGGIHDQLGGGFHRYSVDREWRVPHFEKMLYVQAQLASVYLSAWQVSGEVAFKKAARDTLDYVRREMTAEGGGFYSAEDADSALATAPTVHQEGAFYVWRAQEIADLLRPAEAAVFNLAYGVEANGNASGDLAGQNVLYRAHTAAECAAQLKSDEAAIRATLDAATQRLFEVRQKRPRPLRDDKIVTAWNGLMISAFARAAQVFDEPSYAASAERAASFLRAKVFNAETGRLARSLDSTTQDSRGFVEDYAFLIQGLLDLYETDFDARWLEWAVQLQEKQNALFLDPARGGYFANTSDDPSLLLRLKEETDGAEPSPNSIAVRNLARLSEMTQRPEWRELAERNARAFSAQLQRDPTAMPLLLTGLGWLESSPKQILILGDASSPAAARLAREVWRRYLPRRILLRIDRTSRGFFSPRLPLVADLPEIADDTAIAYVCENFTCQLPTSDPEVLAKLLTGKPAPAVK